MWSLVIANIFAEIEGGETTAKQIKLAKKYMKDVLMPGGSKSLIPWLRIFSDDLSMLHALRLGLRNERHLLKYGIHHTVLELGD